MKFSSSIALLSSVAAASAAESICDYYTSALFKGKGGNSAANQETLLTLVVNTAVIGNYSTINTGVAVPGLLAPTTYNGENVALLPYFDGSLASTNNGGKCGVSVNFLDSGGANALMENKPAFSKDSQQYMLLTHLYQFFASLLGCSKFSVSVMPYAGQKSMYEVHKFMGLDANELGWFVENVGLSALSFGVSQSDADAVGSTLNALFGQRCEPKEAIPPVPVPHLQSICIDCSCPKASPSACQDYEPVVQPQPAGQSSGWCGSYSWHQSCDYCGEQGSGGYHHGGYHHGGSHQGW